MADAVDVDIEHLKTWIGRTEEAEDTITPRLVAAFDATLETRTGGGDAASLAIHWCLAPPIVPVSATGPDGHPARGGFLPPVPLPRRMWAGGELAFHDPLRVGDDVHRRSRIEDVALKQGRSGRLCFVTVRHEISTARGLAIDERQDIVYRDAGPAGTAGKGDNRAQEATPTAPAEHSRTVLASPLLLFRYSALTFNGHRIHYDVDYCREEEGYPGLVVHGPMQATMLLHLAAEAIGRTPSVFSYRGVSPLFDGDVFSVNAVGEDAGLRLWAADSAGRQTMQAKAR